MDNAITFGAQAQTYASSRPGYPEELFDWIGSQAPATDKVWDVGTGSGQAAQSLVAIFSQVYATDIDSQQVGQAIQHERIKYSCSPSHESGLPSNFVDAITVATALHWFSPKLFWDEVVRVAKPGAIFCGWTYHRAITDDDVQKILIEPILDIVEPYWSEGNRLSWRGYSHDELAMPFNVIEMPEFECRLSWTPNQIANLIRSWSAHKKARLDGHQERLNQIEQKAIHDLGNMPRLFILPLNTLAGRIAL